MICLLYDKSKMSAGTKMILFSIFLCLGFQFYSMLKVLCPPLWSNMRISKLRKKLPLE